MAALYAPVGVDVALRDGSTVHVRPVRADDAERMTVFLGGLSDQDRAFRFFSGGVDVRRAAGHLTTPPPSGLGLVATTGQDGRIVGHGAYVREADDAPDAEVAFAVDATFQHHGLATTLLVQLAEAAHADGVETFTAVVLPANHRMIDVFRDSGFAVEIRADIGELQVRFPTAPTPEGSRWFADRERRVAAAALGHVLRPASVAVVGASSRRGSIGGEVLHNIVAFGYRGRLTAVNPHPERFDGVEAHACVADVPWPIELAVITLAADLVLDAARECAAAGVRALVVISAGFSETGDGGREREAELRAICRASGMRMVGPNCLGVINLDPQVRLDATFSPGVPPPGRAGFASQSGAFGIAAIDLARARGIGLSSFVSLGDKADLSGNDVLHYWEDDEATDVILLYLESFGNPRRFGRIARRIGATKPIIAVKSGRTAAGSRAASSHTGALLAASDTTVDALFEHAGVIRADSVDELFDVAALLTGQPLPGGHRVVIVTNVGGPGIMCADALTEAGLRVDPLGQATRAALRAELPAEASVGNPVDLIASATAADFGLAVQTVLADADVDAVVTVFVRPLSTHASEVHAAVSAAAAGQTAPAKPVLSVFLGADVPATAATPATAGTPARVVPISTSVEAAARALGLVARHAAHRRAGEDPPVDPAGIDENRAAAVLADALAAGQEWLAPAGVEALLSSYGIPLAPSAIVRTPPAAARAASWLGFPVALKAVAPGLMHKSDAGAVALDLATSSAVVRTGRAMRRRLARDGIGVEGFLVQRMAPAGAELIVGLVGDRQFGPLVAVGAGGTAAELLGDVQVRLAPVGRRTARAMLRGLRMFPLLDGFRAAPRCDLAAVEDLIGRVGRLAAAHPEVAELDCNPVVAGPDGAVVVDARVRVERPAERPPWGALDR